MIQKYGQVVITESNVVIRDFTFNEVDLGEGGKEALRWALEQLKERMWEFGMRNL